MSDGVKKVSDGVMKVSAGFRKVLEGVRKVSVGVRKVSVGVRKGPDGFKKVSERCHTVSGTCQLVPRMYSLEYLMKLSSNPLRYSTSHTKPPSINSSPRSSHIFTALVTPAVVHGPPSNLHVSS